MKKMRIELKHEFGNARISEDEYPNLMLDHEVSEDEFNTAIDTLITYFAQKDLFHILIDLKMRNDYQGPAKEMTMEEIEEQLGYKIKIVKEKDNGNR